MAGTIQYARTRLPDWFNADPPAPGLVRWWVDNGRGGGWLVWAAPDWDGDRKGAQ